MRTLEMFDAIVEAVRAHPIRYAKFRYG
jgi:hypothetical protein